MNPQQKKQLEALAYAAQLQDYATKYLAYAMSLPTGGVTAQDGDNPVPPKLPPPPPVNS